MIIHGNNIEILRTMADNSVDSIVTDPPYGLKFMNKHWDYDVPNVDFWSECYRVLKPGGYVLSFGGTRTYHRMTVNIEDAGFEIRDMISWLYGSGFPKSLDIGKAIDKMQGNERKIIGKKEGTYADIKRDKETGQDGLHGGIATDRPRVEVIETKGNSEFEGWGTALKPACEPICVARKPIEGTVAENVLKYGTGGINIDEGRIGIHGSNLNINIEANSHPQGRFPANIILDESAAVMLDEQSGESKSTGGNRNFKESFNDNPSRNWHSNIKSGIHHNDSGGASRFFYVAKASKSERNKGLEGFEEKKIAENTGRETKHTNNHPTVKPVKLMQYLVRLVTSPNGVCLDPFCGSGTTGIACKLEGFEFIGIEREKEYCDIAEARIKAWEIEKPEFEQEELF